MNNIIDRLDSTLQSQIKRGKKGYIKFIFHFIILFSLLKAYLLNHGMYFKKNVKGKNVVITGAGMGLGRRLTYMFASKNVKLFIIDKNQKNLAQIFNIIEKQFPNVKINAYVCDVSQEQEIKTVMESILQQIGSVDILINNAGIVSGKSLLQSNQKIFKKVLNVNCLAHLLTVKQVLPKMIQKNSGHIVTIASLVGIVGINGLPDFCASKFGAVGFDESLRMQMKNKNKNIKTTCICPFFINTGLFYGVKTNFLLQLLDQQYVCNRIIWAIQQQEQMVVIPYWLTYINLIRGLVSTRIFDWLISIIGANSSMQHFIGRQ